MSWLQILGCSKKSSLGTNLHDYRRLKIVTNQQCDSGWLKTTCHKSNYTDRKDLTSCWIKHRFFFKMSKCCLFVTPQLYTKPLKLWRWNNLSANKITFRFNCLILAYIVSVHGWELAESNTNGLKKGKCNQTEMDKLIPGFTCAHW